ncbi:MAG: recombinase family protein [Rubrobacter sp.]|nr:recombinase family protein [Rubrobacter sp.]
MDEEEMPVVRRIFHMVGVEGHALHATKRILEAEGVATPAGNKHWNTRSIRTFILDDVYKPYTYEEIEVLVARNVTTHLDRENKYGVWWFNRERITRRKVAEVSLNGDRVYLQKTKTTLRPKEEWIAVPVPDSSIPREVVDAARRAIADNKPPSSNGDRFWELSGGILRCSACGLRMRTTTTRKANKTYYYYHCKKHREEWDACPNRKNHRGEELERQVRNLVREAMTDPEQLRADLDRMIELERQQLRGDPDREAKAWLDKIAEVDRMRSGYQELAAKGLMTFEELDASLKELKNTRGVAARELETIRGAGERIEQMERDRDSILELYAGMAPEALDSLTPEERHRFYKMGRLEVTADIDGRIEVTGPLVANLEVCSMGSASGRRRGTRTPSRGSSLRDPTRSRTPNRRRTPHPGVGSRRSPPSHPPEPWCKSPALP